MKVPLSWLREYVDISIPADELGHRLTMAGTEIESIEVIGGDWERVFVAKLLTIEQHPNADSLLVCRADAGPRGQVTVVTGATNLRAGDLVPMVAPGGRLADGRAIESVAMRGIVSQGMFCSGDELGISPDRSAIYVIDEPIELGRPLSEVFGDTVLDLYITPNRPDCMSMYGIAREIHAITGAPLRRIATSPPVGDVPVHDVVSVAIEAPDLCRRFTAAYIGNATIGPSPGWLQRRLHLAGVRPISNVVDATNYTMVELGAPQHAFDADALGPRIVVRRARPGERLVTLDGVDRELDPDMLVIADAANAVGIAGVMGGGASEVSDRTRNVLLETANFLPTSIRRTSSRLKLGSEASRRFERGTHPELAMVAAERTVALIARLTGGSPASGIVDEYPTRLARQTIDVSERDISALLGHRYERSTVVEVLKTLDFEIDERGDSLAVTVPIHRLDVEGRPDLAEEVARVMGYDAIPDTLPTGAPPEPLVDPLRAAGERARDVLTSAGLSEAMTYSLVAPGSGRRLLGDAAVDPIPVANAISAEQSVLRAELIPSLLDVVRSNLRHREGVAIFELARVYLPPLAPLPSERLRLAIAMTGPLGEPTWNETRRAADFFDLKGVIESLLGSFGVRGSFAPSAHQGYHPGRRATLSATAADGSSYSLGALGQIHPKVAERFDLEGRELVVTELDFEALVACTRGQDAIRGLPRFPAVDRDIALVVDASTPHAEVAATLGGAAGDLLAELRLFDVYEGEPLAAGKRSLAYTLRFRADDRTLRDEEADAAVEAMVQACARAFGATLRGAS